MLRLLRCIPFPVGSHLVLAWFLGKRLRSQYLRAATGPHSLHLTSSCPASRLGGLPVSNFTAGGQGTAGHHHAA